MGPDDRVQMHRNVIGGAKRAGVRKLLYTSVIGNGLEDDTLFAPVQAVNRQAEEDLKRSGLEWVIGRNGLYLEIDVEHIVAAAQEGGVFRNSGGRWSMPVYHAARTGLCVGEARDRRRAYRPNL